MHLHAILAQANVVHVPPLLDFAYFHHPPYSYRAVGGAWVRIGRTQTPPRASLVRFPQPRPGEYDEQHTE